LVVHKEVNPTIVLRVDNAYPRSDLLVRHERLTHRKDRDIRKNSTQTPNDTSYAPTEEQSRKRLRASYDASRPVPEIPGMMSSPTVFETHVQQDTPEASFASTSGMYSNSYSLTALSMAAEYQSLQGNMASEDSRHHSVSTPCALPTVTIDATADNPETAIPLSSLLHVHGPTLQESADSLALFLDNEPLNSYHFATLMSAEQPM
jgi:hypothetical protein